MARQSNNGLEELLAGFFAAMDQADAVELMQEYQEITGAYDDTSETSTRAMLESDLDIEDLDELEDEGGSP